MKKKKVKLYRSNKGSGGQIRLKRGKLHILIRYCPQRVAFLRAIPNSRYDQATKSWIIRPEHYPKIAGSDYFPPADYPRNFSDQDLMSTEAEQKDLEAEAIAAYRSNPLCVSKKYLRFLELDLSFTMSKDSPQIMANINFGSKATAFLAKSKAAILLKRQSAFFIITEYFPALLSRLRDKNFRFAVEEELSGKLSESAVLRKQLLACPEKASAEDLEKAFLTPIIDFSENSGDPIFFIRHANSSHLQRFFPEERSWSVAKKRSASLRLKDLLQILSRKEVLGFPVYLCASVYQHLKHLGIQADKLPESNELALGEELLDYDKHKAVWVFSTDGRAGLVTNHNISEDQQISSAISQKIGDKIFHIEPHCNLLAFYSRYKSSINAVQTSCFKRLISELECRKKLIDQNLQARKLSDCRLPADLFSDPELAGRLFPHQRVAVNWLIERDFGLLGDDMGLGKTLSVLASIDSLKKAEKINFSLIVCPNSLSRNWLNEARLFVPGLRFVELADSPKDRAAMFRQIQSGILVCDGLVINYEKLRRPDVREALTELLQNKSALLCCDESQRLKNPGSKTFMALREISALFKRRIALSGTPTPRDITDVWAQTFLLDQGQRFGTNYYNWLKNIAELGTKYSEYAVKSFKPFAVEETVSRVHELLLRRRKEEVIELPEKTFVSRFCKMESSQAERYNQLCEELLVKIRSIKGKVTYRLIDNILEEYLRAVQIASNPRLVDSGWQGDPVKFQELDQIVDEVVREKREKMIIWTNYLGNVAELSKRYQEYGCAAFSGEVSTEDRDQTVRNFQTKPEPRILVAVPAAGGVGITLTAAQTAVYLDKTWNAEHWLQSVDRIHRIGQCGTVTIISLSACKVDELIHRNLLKKSKALGRLLGDHSLPWQEQQIEQSGAELNPGIDELIKTLAAE